MADIRILHAEETRGFALRVAAALAAEGYSVLREDPASTGFGRQADAVVVVWSASLIDARAALAEAREALAARRLVPVALGRVEPPASFSHLEPIDLMGWTGAREDPRWRFVLDEIDVALRFRAASGPNLFFDEEPEDAGFPGEEDESSFHFPMRTAVIGAAALALAALAVALLAPIASQRFGEGPRVAMLERDNGARETETGEGTVEGTGEAERGRPALPESGEETPDAPSSEAGPSPEDAPRSEDAPARSGAGEALTVPPAPVTQAALDEDLEPEAGGASARPGADDGDGDPDTEGDIRRENVRGGDLNGAPPERLTPGGEAAPPPDAALQESADAAPEEAPQAAPGDAPDTEQPLEIDTETGTETAETVPAQEGALAEGPVDLVLPAAAPDDYLGVVFRDCLECPDMAELPGGAFVMGADGAAEAEGPAHVVNIAPFALARTEVTFAQWGACVADGGCRAYAPADQGWGRRDRPVVNVSWRDAQNYAAWLTRRTGRAYRLPSEAEWEFAAKAGAESAFSFGAAPAPGRANYAGALRAVPPEGEEAVSVRITAPAGSYPANAFGLYDMHGNVWEWTADCWAETHAGAPVDGAPREWECGERVLKGGAFDAAADRMRAAHRIARDAGARRFDAGFRVARDLR